MVTYHNGDLLKSECDIICHQVNTFGIMGAGIAKQIRSTYPSVFKQYSVLCETLSEELLLGHIDIEKIPKEEQNNKIRIVLNLFSELREPINNTITDYELLKKCFLRIIRLDFIKPDTKVGIPYKIGCGIANGDWNKVRDIIHECFDDVPFEVQIWNIEPVE